MSEEKDFPEARTEDAAVRRNAIAAHPAAVVCKVRRSKRLSQALFTICAVGAFAGTQPVWAQTLPWMNKALAPEQRAALLVSAMTRDEKIQQIAMNPAANANLQGCGFLPSGRHIEGIARLAIPTVRMTNGPIGVGGGDCSPDRAATGVPTALSAAASWDRAVWTQWGDIVGSETRANAHHIFLAPGMNMARAPQNGRNFEYLGEDPLLTGTASVAMTRAIQANGVLASAKHYAANEQETQRQTMNSIIEDRTLHELYLLPFEMVIKDAEAASVMCSYPRVNGAFSCENTPLLKDVLREQWGFKGFVMSDRGATQSTAPSIKAGLDLEFAKPDWFRPDRIKAALDANEITLADLDTMLQRRFRMMFKFGQFDKPITAFAPTDLADHGAKARAMAEQGSVLLKNAFNTLPLHAKALRSIALIGPPTFAAAAKLPATGPGGFITVNTSYSVTPMQGLRRVLDSLGSTATVTYNDGKDINSATALARASDVTIVMVGDISLEGVDRQNLNLPTIDGVDQQSLVSAIASVQPRSVVVLKDGGPILMPWIDHVAAVLEVWYPGQEDGNAVANLLFGAANPSGKLPVTFPRVEREAAVSTMAQWPGVVVNGVLTATYAEGLEMGYRWYDAHKAAPQFPFGFGLSYTSFAYSGMTISSPSTDGRAPLSITVSIRNTGTAAGAEVTQLYATFPAQYGEPKRLVGFEKVYLAPGEQKQVTIAVDPQTTNHPLSYWNTEMKSWQLIRGKVDFQLGRSSRQIEKSFSVTVMP